MDRQAWPRWYRGTYLGTEHWHRVQKHVYARSGGRCERCKKNDMDHVHHNHYYSLWHELEDPTSVKGLCADCHAFVHGLSTYDPLSPEPPDPDGPAAPVPKCVDCGQDEEVTLTENGEPICRDCLRERNMPG
jgi:hypothetical protein